MLRVAALTLALCLFPIVAAAERAETHCDNEQDCTEYFMDGDDVYGGMDRPDADLMTARGEFLRPPLIRVRSHFVDMMLKSVEDM